MSLPMLRNAPLPPAPAPETTSCRVLMPLLPCEALMSRVAPLLTTIGAAPPAPSVVARPESGEFIFTVPPPIVALPVKSFVVAISRVLLPSLIRLAAPLMLPGPLMVKLLALELFALKVVASTVPRLSQLAELSLSQAPVLFVFHASDAATVGGVIVRKLKVAA